MKTRSPTGRMPTAGSASLCVQISSPVCRESATTLPSLSGRYRRSPVGAGGASAAAIRNPSARESRHRSRESRRTGPARSARTASRCPNRARRRVPEPAGAIARCRPFGPRLDQVFAARRRRGRRPRQAAQSSGIRPTTPRLPSLIISATSCFVCQRQVDASRRRMPARTPATREGSRSTLLRAET